MIYTDFVDAWGYNFKVYRHIDESYVDEYGMMFKKNSQLRKDLDKAFAEFKKTASYKKLIKKHFGSYSKSFFNL